MKHFFAILLSFVLLIIFCLPVVVLNYIKNEENEFNNAVLSAALDYAGEAAMNACAAESLEIEYEDIDSMILTPENAIEVFAATLCVSYNMPVTKINTDMIKNSISVMLLAANDGYYIAEHQKVDDYGDYELLWSPKKAYLIDTNPNNADGYAYGVELGLKRASIINKSTLTYTKTNSYAGLPSAEIIYQLINRAINRDVNAALARYAASRDEESFESFYLPVSDSGISGVNRIERPTLIILLHNFSINGSVPADYTSVNGMRISAKNYVVAWTDNAGNKYYSSEELNAAAASYAALNGVIFDSAAEAAKAGYYPFIN